MTSITQQAAPPATGGSRRRSASRAKSWMRHANPASVWTSFSVVSLFASRSGAATGSASGA